MTAPDHLSPEDAARLKAMREIRAGYEEDRGGYTGEHIDFLLRLLDETPEIAPLLAEIARLKAAPSHRNYVEIARLRALVIERGAAVLAELAEALK